MNPNFLETGVAILSGTTSTTKESKTVIVQLFGSESAPKNKEVAVKTVTIAKTTTTTMPVVVTSTTTSTLKLVAQVDTTIEDIFPAKPIAKNQIELTENDSPESIVSTEDLQNVSLTLNDQNILMSDPKIIGYTLTKDVVDGSFLK